MSNVRLDKVLFSTFHEAYKNYATMTDTFNVTAIGVGNGATQNYVVTIPYSRGGTRADIYLDGNSTKILANASTRLETNDPYQFTSTETASVLIEYTSSSIVVTLSIFNGTGGPITLTAQTITVQVVEYDAPITPI